MTLDTTQYVHIIKKNSWKICKGDDESKFGIGKIWPGKSVFHVIIVQDLSTADFHVCVWNDWFVYINFVL